VRVLPPDEGSALHAAAAPGPGQWALVGPLRASGDATSLLVVTGDEAVAAYSGLVGDLLEAMAAAVANDRRLNELARLREAAEADKAALLTRLDRQDVSEAIVGAEGGLRTVMERVDQVARTDAPVLILGETGSGKEVVARAIHHRSRRAAGPFLRVNCGAIPPELVDSELFGHERGSFTGAIATRQGWFERADGGTLFLDEIGELPPAAQVRLLRVLQDGTFERVGGGRTLTADVRIVAATHRPMQDLVRDGRFREDLWYRVSVFPVALPPLRERAADIPVLAGHFARRAGLRLHGASLTPSAHDVALLQAYAWPGNVRELAAVIERAAILGDGRRLEVAAALGGAAPSPVVAVATGTLEDASRRAIAEALHRAGGRVEGAGGAAELLGINAGTLRSRMRRLGIDWSAWRRAGGVR
jgi:transcriptional regulator with GAF, ATPase, and Fis domain